MEKTLDSQKIKADFPIFSRKVNGKPLIYLDNAATSQKPMAVLEAMDEFYSRFNANVHRGVHTLAEEATLAYEDARKKVARFINAKPEEIIFTKNATEAINLVMYSYGMGNVKKGQKVVTSIMDHHSSFVPAQQLAKRKGAKFEVMQADGNWEIPDSELAKLEGAAIASVVHASNVSGTINDVKKMAEIAHENGGVFLADASQSVPHMPVDVKKLGVDFLAFTGHKMLGPMGIGALYGKKEALEGMEPFLFGGDMVFEVQEAKSTWADGPAKFEAGTPNVAGAVGLGAAMDYLGRLGGMESVREHDKYMLKNAIAAMNEIDGLALIGPQNIEKRTGIISFTVEGVHSHDLAQVLDQEGIAIRAGHHCAQPFHNKLGLGHSTRASFYIYNSKEDIAALCAGIEKAKKVFA